MGTDLIIEGHTIPRSGGVPHASTPRWRGEFDRINVVARGCRSWVTISSRAVTMLDRDIRGGAGTAAGQTHWDSKALDQPGFSYINMG